MSIEAQEDLWQAVLQRDAGRDGAFYYAVKSTGIYCRPSCPSRRPRRMQVAFYGTTQEAERDVFVATRDQAVVGFISGGAMPAVGNALVDALQPLGIREVPMPATPERLWRAIREARG